MQRRSLFLMLVMLPLGMALGQAESLASLELNQASRAQLESLPGLGPALTERLLAARQQQPFADWPDLLRRVKGLGPRLAARLSAQGLRVQGLGYEAPIAQQTVNTRPGPASRRPP